MASLFTKVKLYLEANSKTVSEFDENIALQNDGSGDYIHTWNVSGLEKPTDEQLNSYSSQADTNEANNEIINTRKSLYGTSEQQIENIIENGLDAEISRVNQIKSENPKS